MFAKHGTKPKAEVYDSGMLNNIAYLVNRGYVQKPVHMQFVLGVLGALSASIENLCTHRREVRSIL